MIEYPENRSYTDSPNEVFPVGDADLYFMTTASKYVDNLRQRITQHSPLSSDEPHPLETMMRRAMVEQNRQKPGHARTFNALRDLAAAWDDPDDLDDPHSDFYAASEGVATALVFLRESHIIPSQYSDFSKELTYMQHYTEPYAQITIADFTDNAWQGMQRNHPAVHQLFSEVRDLLLAYHHIQDDDPQAVRVRAGMALVYITAVASKLVERAGTFSTCDDYFAQTMTTTGDWLASDPPVVPNLRALISDERLCIRDADRDPLLPQSIVREREALAERAFQLLNAERKRDYEATKDQTRSILGAFLMPDQGAAKAQRERRQAIQDRKILDEHEKFFEGDE